MAVSGKGRMMYQYIKPKEYIRDVLISEIGDVVNQHSYLAFTLICSGIEFLGVCLDTNWHFHQPHASEHHFMLIIDTLFPERYQPIKQQLYSQLRCGITHCELSGHLRLIQVGNVQNEPLLYEQYLTEKAPSGHTRAIIIEYLYFDFVQACLAIMAKEFAPEDKMNVPMRTIG